MSSCHSNQPHKEHVTHVSHEDHKRNQHMESPAASNVMAGQTEIYTCPMHPQIRQNGPGSCPINGQTIALGNRILMEENNTDITGLSAKADELRTTGATVIFMSVDGKAAGLLAIADPIKQTTPQAIKELQALGIKIVMLTGDNRKTAEAVARTLGITEVEAEVLPEDKARIVKTLRDNGRVSPAIDWSRIGTK